MRSKVCTLSLLLVSVFLWSTVGFAETAKATGKEPTGWSKGAKKGWSSAVPPGQAKKMGKEMKAAEKKAGQEMHKMGSDMKSVEKKTGRGMHKMGAGMKTEAGKVKTELEKGAVATEQGAEKLGMEVKEKL